MPPLSRYKGSAVSLSGSTHLIFSFYSPIVVPMRALPFPKCCVVCCKKCGHDVLTGTDSFPAGSIFVVCSLCGEKRRYLPSEVIHGSPHFVVRRNGRRGPVAAHLGRQRPLIISAKARAGWFCLRAQTAVPHPESALPPRSYRAK